MTNLSKKMQRTLLLVGYGVSPTVNGYISDDDSTVRVDLRSVLALARRGLVTTTGMSVRFGLLVSALDLTESGRNEFDLLLEEEWERRKQ